MQVSQQSGVLPLLQPQPVCLQGLVALHTNPILADSTAGLATTATAFAAIEVRTLLLFCMMHT